MQFMHPVCLWTVLSEYVVVSECRSEERNDVLMLVDSDDDAPFEDDVSGLTSLTNGNATPVVNDQHTTRGK